MILIKQPFMVITLTTGLSEPFEMPQTETKPQTRAPERASVESEPAPAETLPGTVNAPNS